VRHRPRRRLCPSRRDLVGGQDRGRARREEFTRIAERWFSTPNIYYLLPVPVATAALAYLAWWSLRIGHEVTPFIASIGLFLLAYLGLAISSFPYMVPPSLTIWDTAAAPESQIFSLFGILFMLPIILGYVVFVYWTFRGKVRAGEGYH
jgi:cytochrome d ubiquinol oxidase subunit II